MKSRMVRWALFMLALSFPQLAQAALIAGDPFRIGVQPSLGEYQASTPLASTAGVNQDPTIAGFFGTWSGGTGTIQVNSTSLAYSTLTASGGSVQYRYGGYLTDYARYVQRRIDSSYDQYGSVYYLAGLMSFDSGFVNPDDRVSVALTQWTSDYAASDLTVVTGLQWGFKENATHGVDAIIRIRDTDTLMHEYTLAANLTPGTHLFVAKINPDWGGSDPLFDKLSVWLDPTAIGSEDSAGLPAFTKDNVLVYVRNNPGYTIDTLAFHAGYIGENSSVGFDEVRFGTEWSDVIVPEPASGLLGLAGGMLLVLGGRRRLGWR